MGQILDCDVSGSVVYDKPLAGVEAGSEAGDEEWTHEG